MKNKFIEFSKDYGLIVVGYAGNDRSIMDILSFSIEKRKNSLKMVFIGALEKEMKIFQMISKNYYGKIKSFSYKLKVLTN